MLQDWAVLAISLAYLGIMFAIAWIGERIAARWRNGSWAGAVYALSLAIYCTSWTFYGSVGRAVHVGLGFLAIYIGPILVITLGYPILRKMIVATQRQNVTSIADFLGARYGKSRAVAALVTVIAVIGGLPYLALQLKAVAQTFDILTRDVSTLRLPDGIDSTLLIAMLLGAFTIWAGVRQIQAVERRPGMMLTIAFESVVKLLALLAVGLLAALVLSDPLDPVDTHLIAQAYESLTRSDPGFSDVVVTILSAAAFLCLPRQFHVATVECQSVRHLRQARWLFPLYLVLINLPILPIALAGLTHLPPHAGPDSFVLTLPLHLGQPELALFAFIGGLSASAAMVMVACMALSIMVGNELITPLLLRLDQGRRKDFGPTLLFARRAAVGGILAAAWLYHGHVGRQLPLASIGLLSFAAVAQFAPGVILGLYWRRAHRVGMLTGLTAGFTVWLFQIAIPAMNPYDDTLLVQGVVTSLAANLLCLVLGSLIAQQDPTDRQQAEAFVTGAAQPASGEPGDRAALEQLAARFIGRERSRAAFADVSVATDLIAHTERLLSGAIGAASARVVMAGLGAPQRLSGRAARAMLDEASAAVRRNLHLLRTTLDHISQGIGVVGPDGRLVLCNDRFCELLGVPQGLARVSTPLWVLAEAAGIPPADLMSPLDGPLVLERTLAVERSLEIRIDPMPDGGRVVTCSDITERVRTQAALVDSERRIRVYTDNVPVLIAYVDREERYRFTNRPYQDALNLSAADLDGKLLSEMLGPERYRRLRPHIEGVLAGRPQSFEIEFPTNARHVEVARGSYLPHFGPRGDVLGFFLLYQDMTERRQAEQALRLANESLERRVAERTAALSRAVGELEQARAQAESANAAKTRFLAAASHDLLQPLHAARLFTAALSERHPADDLVARVEQGLGAVEALLDALLDISKLDSGRMEAQPGPVALGTLLGALTASLAPLAAQRGVQMRLVPTAAQIVSDPAMLRRIIQNLLSNAIRYSDATRARPRVLIGCRHRAGAVRVEVWDCGPGIDPDKQSLIFEEFVRLPGPQPDGGPRGLGLGLAIVERMASRLGHMIGLRSWPGRGSCFSVTLPLARTRLPTASEPPTLPPVPTAASLTVLCIDDDPEVRAAMASLMAGWGHRALIAESLDAAHTVLAVAGALPDLVLADLQLGQGPDGITVIDRLRTEWRRPVPAALITANREEDLKARCKEAGIDLLFKPVKPAQLRALIAQRCARLGLEAAD